MEDLGEDFLVGTSSGSIINADANDRVFHRQMANRRRSV